LRVTWRVGVAATVMTAGVLYLQTIWPQSARLPVMAAQLAGESATGAVLYIAVLLGLWRLAGRPEGPENHAVAAAAQLLPRLGGFLRFGRPASSSAQ
jgi:hypothetical protein